MFKKILNKPNISLWILIVTLSGAFFGIAIFYTFISTTHLVVPYRESGADIISITTLLHYPKRQDTLIYFAGMTTTIFCGLLFLFLWLYLAKLLSGNNIALQKLSLTLLSPVFLFPALSFHTSLTKHNNWSAFIYPISIFILITLVISFIIKYLLSRFVISCASINIPSSIVSNSSCNNKKKIFSSNILNNFSSILDYLFIPAIIILIYYYPIISYSSLDSTHNSDWDLMGESGVHLAWVQSILNGGFQGRDFFGLYGPLHELVIIPFMKIWGTSYLSFQYAQFFLSLTSYVLIYIALRQFFNNRIIVLLSFIIVLEFAFSNIRFSLALFAVALTIFSIRKETLWTFLLSGIFSGISLFYSQEFGLCAIFSSIICICFWKLWFPTKSYKPLIYYFTGILAGIMPVIIYFALNAALVDMLYDFFLFPIYASKGHGNLIIPSLKPYLIHRFSLNYYINMFFSFSQNNPFIWYQPPFIYSLSILYVIVKLLRENLVTKDIVLLATIVFGIFSFKVALGRSDLTHLKYVFGPTVILYMIYVEKCVYWIFNRKSEEPFYYFIAKKLVALGVIISFLLGGNGTIIKNFFNNFTVKLVNPIDNFLHRNLEPSQLERLYAPVSDINNPLVETAKFVINNTPQNKPILSIPQNAGFYFLCNRNNATRFALSLYIVTDKHREEFLNAIKNKKPSAIIYDSMSQRIDYIPDYLRFGQETINYIKNNYRIVKVIPPYYILFPK